MEPDCDSSGDLGLGRGLKPGAVCRNYQLDHHQRRWSGCERSPSGCSVPAISSNSVSDQVKGRSQSFYVDPNEETACGGHSSRRCSSGTDRCHTAASNIPSKDLTGIDGKQREDSVAETTSCPSANNFSSMVTTVKQQVTEQEVEELKQDLELCRIQLCAKYQATKILQGQLEIFQNEKEILSGKSENLNKALIQELNRVQFEMKCHESKLLESQEKWAAKFDGICLENLRLAADLEKQVLIQRKLYAEKTALSRERDELLALMRVHERSKHELVQPKSLDLDPLDEFTSLELAVLGACRCRSESHDACSCAVTAACLRKEIFRTKEETEQLKQERDDALAMADIYRIAFDDQLSRNRGLVRQITELCKELDVQSSGCHDKLSSSIVRLLRKENGYIANSHAADSEPVVTNAEKGNDHKMEDLMKQLEETLADKSEALAHQKFATKLLAIRVRQLEEKLLTMHNDESPVIRIDNCNDNVS